MRAEYWLSLAVLTSTVAVTASEPGLEPLSGANPGLVAERPLAGVAIKTAHGFMVPYTARLPGTKVEYTMIPVPGGIQEMEREGTTFQVIIEPFWIGKTEVTWAEYMEYMKLYLHFRRFERRNLRLLTDGNRLDGVTAPTELYDPDTIYVYGKERDQPARGMRQFAAKQYTKWLSLQFGRFYRLPCEAEWEYACRAGAAGAYSFGDNAATLGDYAWYVGNSDYISGRVATKEPNAWGLYDMHGKAAEWVLDGVESDSSTPKDGEKISVADAIAWPNTIFGRIAKGGSMVLDAEDCSTKARTVSSAEWLSSDPDSPPSPHWSSDGWVDCTVGFRLLRPLRRVERPKREKFWEPDVEELEQQVARWQDNGRGNRGLVDPALSTDVKKLPRGW